MKQKRHCDTCECFEEACVCDPDTWGDDIKPICKRYDDKGGQCRNCDHDKECHDAEATA